MTTSVSSHLSPEPERRLLIILDHVTQTVQWTDLKIGALTAFAAAELSFLKPAASDPMGLLAAVPLALSLPLGVLGFSPLTGKPSWLPLLEPSVGGQGPEDNLISVDDLVKYTHGELVNRLDRYLGGGIVATPYHEGIVEQIVTRSRVAARKKRLFWLLCLLAGTAQVAFVGLLLRS